MTRFIVALACLSLFACAGNDGSTKDQALPSISLEAQPSSGTVAIGKTIAFTVKQRTSNGLEPIQGTARWTSGNESIATIDPNTGVATGKAVGKVQIVAAWGPGSAALSLEVTP